MYNVEDVGGDKRDQPLDLPIPDCSRRALRGRNQAIDGAERDSSLVLDAEAHQVTPVVLTAGGFRQGLARSSV